MSAPLFREDAVIFSIESNKHWHVSSRNLSKIICHNFPKQSDKKKKNLFAEQHGESVLGCIVKCPLLKNPSCFLSNRQPYSLEKASRVPTSFVLCELNSQYSGYSCPDFNYSTNTPLKTGTAGNFAVTWVERRTDKRGSYIPTNFIKLSQHISSCPPLHYKPDSREEYCPV